MVLINKLGLPSNNTVINDNSSSIFYKSCQSYQFQHNIKNLTKHKCFAEFHRVPFCCLQILNTVKSLLTNTSIKRTPLQDGHLVWSLLFLVGFSIIKLSVKGRIIIFLFGGGGGGYLFRKKNCPQAVVG